MEEIPGLVDIKSSTEGGNPELQIRFDRERLASFGLTLAEVAAVVGCPLGTAKSRLLYGLRKIEASLARLRRHSYE